ncbi:MAG TPA: hypothetical protein PKY64_02770, partial [Anaerolineaceae bacterium]|nr:hypothetical protein [Anaerolineaceae bacterium]
MSDKIPEVNAGRRRKSSNRPTTQGETPIRRPFGSSKPSAKPTRPTYSGGSSQTTGGFPSGSSSSGSSGLGGLLGGLGSSSSSSASGSTGGLGGLMGSSGSKKSCGGIIGIIILGIVLFFLFRSCQGGFLPEMTAPEQDPGQSVPAYTEPTQPLQPTQPRATSTPWPTAINAGENSGQKWLVMMYQDADDQAL